MIKRAPSPGQLIAMILFALSCFSLILYLWVSFGGPVPLRPQGYRVNVSFNEAVNLAQEGDVRISGVSVGTVKKISPKQGRTDAVLEIDPRYAPLPENVKAVLRTKTLLGETYVELTPGTKDVPTIPENGRIPRSQVAGQVELDEVIRTFDPKTRAAFGNYLVGQADSIQGRGGDLNQVFGVLPVFLSDSNDLFTVLHRQDEALSKVFANTADIFEAIDSRPGQLTELILQSNRLFRVTAHRSQQLTDTFNEFPEFLRQSRETTAGFDAFAKATQPLIKNTTLFATQLSPTLVKATKVTADARAIVSNLEPLLDKADSGLPATDQFLALAKPSIAQLDPFLRNLNPVLQFVGLYQREITAFLGNDASAAQAQFTNAQARAGDATSGHYLRAFATLTPDSLAYYPHKSTATRSNAYPIPGWYDRLAQGLQVFDASPCGTIPVPNLDPSTTTDPTLGSLVPIINNIIYGGGNNTLPSTPATADNSNPTNPLPTPVCSQQPTLNFNGSTLQYPHVTESPAPAP
jgi:phospholipid/cholesterol/gamma-HCH transport system substrate-binding protein